MMGYNPLMLHGPSQKALSIVLLTAYALSLLAVLYTRPLLADSDLALSPHALSLFLPCLFALFAATTAAMFSDRLSPRHLALALAGFLSLAALLRRRAEPAHHARGR